MDWRILRQPQDEVKKGETGVAAKLIPRAESTKV